MRNFFVLLTAIGISSCTVGKKHMPSDQADDTANTQEKHGFTKKNHDSIVIYCGKDSTLNNSKLILYCNQDTGYFDKTKRIIFDKPGMKLCLREKAFLGDTASIRQLAALIPLMHHPFGSFNKRLRGDKIFKAILGRLNNFEFVKDYDGNLSYSTVYNSYASILTDMIESIDGMHQYDYLEIHVKEKLTPDLRELDILSREYIQAMSKVYWELYKEAYDKGLIKLKDFGQE